MTTTKEKLARAIMEARDGAGACMVVDWQREAEENPHVAQALRQATAALEALLEPSDLMVEAGFAVNDGPHETITVIQAAIQAALSEREVW